MAGCVDDGQCVQPCKVKDERYVNRIARIEDLARVLHMSNQLGNVAVLLIYPVSELAITEQGLKCGPSR